VVVSYIVEETGVPGENYRHATSQLYWSDMEYKINIGMCLRLYIYITLINGAFDMSNIYLFKIIYIYNTYQWCVRHVKHLFV
jgi:hypothetical protein